MYTRTDFNRRRYYEFACRLKRLTRLYDELILLPSTRELVAFGPLYVFKCLMFEYLITEIFDFGIRNRQYALQSE